MSKGYQITYVASDPYLGKTSLWMIDCSAESPRSCKMKTHVGHWEVAYQADSALLACMAQACRLRAGQEEASPAS
jgi:hypothetical protein